MPLIHLPVPEPILLLAMVRHGRAQQGLEMVQRDHRALLLQFHEMVSDLDRAARTPAAAPQGPLQARVEEAIVRAPHISDPQELARLSGVSLNVARAVMAFHGKRRRMASRH